MATRRRRFLWTGLWCCTLWLASAGAAAAELVVASSGGFAAAYRALAPDYTRTSGQTLESVWGPSMGATPDAIPNRLARGEPIDVVIMVDSALDELIRAGQVDPASKVVLAGSSIAMAVRAGAPKPSIATVEELKQALLGAGSIAYSDSASGVFLSTVVFPRLGIADQIRGRARMIPAEPVGQVVARGDAEIGFQQLSELLPIPGIDIVGLLPAGAQQVTLFSAGIVKASTRPREAKALIDFLASPAAADAVRRTGLEPMSARPMPQTTGMASQPVTARQEFEFRAE